MALTMAQRAAVYYAQKYQHVPPDRRPEWHTNPPELTARQRRRIRHKRNHQISQAVNGRIRRAAQGA